MTWIVFLRDEHQNCFKMDTVSIFHKIKGQNNSDRGSDGAIRLRRHDKNNSNRARNKQEKQRPKTKSYSEKDKQEKFKPTILAKATTPPPPPTQKINNNKSTHTQKAIIASESHVVKLVPVFICKREALMPLCSRSAFNQGKTHTYTHTRARARRRHKKHARDKTNATRTWASRGQAGGAAGKVVANQHPSSSSGTQ